jgi:starch synthase
MSPINRVVHVTREYGSIAGIGGLREDVKGVAKSSAEHGIETHIFLPYPAAGLNQVDIELEPVRESLTFSVDMRYRRKLHRKESVEILFYRDKYLHNLLFNFVKSPRYEYISDGEGNIRRNGIYTYTEDEVKSLKRNDLLGKQYHDLFETNVLLAKSTLRVVELLESPPDIFHLHDGHTSFLPMIAQESEEGFSYELRRIPSLITIHNAHNRYRGEIYFENHIPALLGIREDIVKDCVYKDKFDPVFAAGLFGTKINTVSENYARELHSTSEDRRADWIGHRLQGIGVNLVGITNGIDINYYNPSMPSKLGIAAALYPETGDYSRKIVCKRDLITKLHLNIDDNTPLLIFAGRFVHQKGCDILASVMDELFSGDTNAVFVAIGTGHPDEVNVLKLLEKKHPEKVRFITPYEQILANQCFAAGDFCIIPSRFEPCGLVDLIAQLFGCIPVVNAVGGLVKVSDGKTGFTYNGLQKQLVEKLVHIINLYKFSKEYLNEVRSLGARTVLAKFGWSNVFRERYLPLYEETVASTKPVTPPQI